MPNKRLTTMSKEFYRRRLPHWQPPEATFFVTYRLAGSIPQAEIKRVRDAYEAEIRLLRDSVPQTGFLGDSVPQTGFLGDSVPQIQIERGFVGFMVDAEGVGAVGAERSSARLGVDVEQILVRLLRRKQKIAEKRQYKSWDDFLDSKLNAPYWLENKAVAELNMKAIQFYDGKLYRLLACTIMSNHVHLMIELLPGAPPLFKVMQNLKRYTALHSNRMLNRTGPFWEEESYDHVVRDYEFDRIFWYILNNPVKAGLVKHWSLWKWTFCDVLIWEDRINGGDGGGGDGRDGRGTEFR